MTKTSIPISNNVVGFSLRAWAIYTRALYLITLAKTRAMEVAMIPHKNH